MIRVVLVNDQELVRAGLRLILEAEADMDVVGEAGEGRRAVALEKHLDPDVVLMDVEMPGVNGLDATRSIVAECPGVNVVMLTTFERDDYVFSAVRHGAAGFLLENAHPRIWWRRCSCRP